MLNLLYASKRALAQLKIMLPINYSLTNLSHTYIGLALNNLQKVDMP